MSARHSNACPQRRLWSLCIVSAVLLSQTAFLGTSQGSDTEVANLNVHNGRFIYSAEEKQGGFNLKLYFNENAPWLDPYRELITHWCAYSTVSPRIALALIELQTGLVSTDVPSSGALRRPFGDLSSSNTFNGQAEEVLRRLSGIFYSHSTGNAGQLRSPDAARRALLSLLGSENRLLDFHRSYQRIFPGLSPLPQGPNSFIDPKSTAPPSGLLQLPFPIGDSWVFNGAHSNLGRDPGPRSSIDFSSNWTQWGTNTSADWVVAAMAGTAIVHSRCLVEVLSSSGWSTSYYHMGTILVANGSFVRKDQRLGTYANVERQALCQADADGPHVHFSLLRKGEYVSLHDALMSAYRVDVGRASYDDDCAHFFLERNGVRHCAGTPIANQSSDLPPPDAPSELQATPISNNEIELTWQDQSTTEERFEIERGQSGSFARIGSVGQGITSFRDSGLSSGSSYDYRVRAVNDSGASAYTAPVSARTQGERMPVGLTAVATSVDAIELSWTDMAETESGYEVEGRSARENAFRLYQQLPANSEATRIDGLLPQTTYTFRVRANGTNGVSTYTGEASATTFNEAPGPCEASDTNMCLSQGRFRVEVDWQRFDGVRGDARRVAEGTDDSGLFWFFQQQNWEMLVKVLDGCGVNENFWVFAAATTNVEYTLRVTDTATGQVKTYFNELGNSAAAITDTQAFSTCGGQTANSDVESLAHTVSWNKPESWDKDNLETTTLSTEMASKEAPSTVAPRPKVGDTSACIEGPTRLCLDGGRFEVTVSWEDFRGSAGNGQTAPLRSDDSGLFWFFNGNNWEMLAKIVNGCELNDHYWVFAASTTNVAYRLSVRDTVTGTVRDYENPLGRSAAAITDSEALAVCP